MAIGFINKNVGHGRGCKGSETLEFPMGWKFGPFWKCLFLSHKVVTRARSVCCEQNKGLSIGKIPTSLTIIAVWYWIEVNGPLRWHHHDVISIFLYNTSQSLYNICKIWIRWDVSLVRKVILDSTKWTFKVMSCNTWHSHCFHCFQL